VRFSRQFISIPWQPSGLRDIPSGRPTIQSIIIPDDENFPSGPSSVSKSCELFQLASVRTFQQHVQTTLSVQPAMDFFPKTQIWEDRCNSPNDVNPSPNELIHKASCAFKNFRRSDDSLNGPDARATYMEMACI
jgi:hypothetical protein